MEKQLHLFIAEYGGCGDYIIAYDEADAFAILAETVGDETAGDYDPTWVQWPDDKPWTLTEIDEPGQPEITLTGAEWAAQYGRRYLGGWA